ncbi:ABC transporter ATP-binding protein [Calothrix sp. UHCC 0171]|uniref:ABC transporter ATP-binding protein n=1 Tax=Calothrix sp. UHCC 0171 TaxID=3110245 RepID=UPI002B217A2D|nr:ABC transporter ATP-binding protein [Calothrix sp. UHCC 0171]MEA5573963.1 ABC transporter ATP-binding protein [Calothrix sp. UHCC 0171]
MTIINEQEIATKPQENESDIVLSVSGVSKKFCRDLKRSLMYGVQDISSELLGLREKSDKLRKKEFWALDNVSFELRRGEAIGLVGKNGSGKSTLLRIIAGLIRPDAGSVEVNGRVAPLIALGAGFNPILTGRENIYANMSILGLSKKEIDERFDEVVEFAEIGDAIDAPVQSYSSGMAARLGFASAIHTNPEILLIDEVLAVGDSRFQAKCFRKLHELRQKNTAFILVSHNSHVILTICESAIFLKHGQVLGFGETPLVMMQYEEDSFFDGETTALSSNFSLIKPRINSDFEITAIFFRNSQGEVIEFPHSGESISLCIACNTCKTIDNVGLTLDIKGLAEGGETILLMNSYSDNQSLSFTEGEHEIQIQMPYLGLRGGTYTMDIYAKRDALFHLDSVEFFKFKVYAKESISRGCYYQTKTWKTLKS